MKTFAFAAALALLLPATSIARPLDWGALERAGAVKSGSVKGDHIHIENRFDEPRRFRLLRIEDPQITQLKWSLHGTVRYADVEGDGYLELNNHLPKGTFFSRTPGAGPMGKLTGTADWRDFVLPFDASEGAPPKALELMVFLPGKGKVDIGPLELVDGSFERDTGVWFSERASGTLYGVLGALFGCLAGLAGVLAGRTRTRPVAMRLLVALVAACAVELSVGLVAFATGQPWFVAYPAVLMGALGAAILLGVRRAVLAKQQQDELRRMQAMDA